MANETKPPTRMSKTELYDALIGLGYTADQLLDDQKNKLKRPQLLDKLNEHNNGENAMSILSDIVTDEDEDDVGIEVLQDTKDDQEPEELEPPTPKDPGWTQYVLGQFQEDEVDGKNPRVEGLRRVAGELVGELIEEGCDLVSPPTEDNRFRACVKAWGVFITKEGITKRFEALADAHDGNCLEDYATYLVAMADTRAKGRMYRNALCLRRVVAAEEVNKTVATAADIQQGGSIHTGQISMIRMISERHGFVISEVLDKLNIEYTMNDNTGDVNLQSLSYENAVAAATEMRKMKEQNEKENS